MAGDGDEGGVASAVGDGDIGSEVACGDVEPAEVDQVLTAGGVGIEAGNGVVTESAGRNRKTSLLAPPFMVSLPAPPSRMSLPMPPLRVSVPALPMMVSLPAEPVRASLPPPPSIESIPVRVTR